MIYKSPDINGIYIFPVRAVISGAETELVYYFYYYLIAGPTKSIPTNYLDDLRNINIQYGVVRRGMISFNSVCSWLVIV